MEENTQELKNHQLLEICGVKIFKQIERKVILEKSKNEFTGKTGNPDTDKK